MLNEYQDFKSGLDALTQKTPFSGGSGALPKHPHAAGAVRTTLWGLSLLFVVLGVTLVVHIGWAILPIGLLGALLIATYTTFITRQPWLCLLAPGLAFGPLMVVGTAYAWSGTFSGLALALSMVPFFLVNNLLLLNQFPDKEADEQVGRFNILMQLGLPFASGLFVAFLGLAYVSLGLSIALYSLPTGVYFGFLTALLALPTAWLVLKFYANLEKMLFAMAMNVIINIILPLVISAGLVWQ
jgi:1,4-dihydroxy-2-naphthoate octaprenyltransferase